MEPQIAFCKSADGTEIGYVKLGAGLPFVAYFPWAGDFEAAWDVPGGREFISALAEHCTVVMIDRRGTGLSQHDVADMSPEAQVQDIGAVVEHERLEAFELMSGYSSNDATVRYTIANAGRVRHLIMMGLFARGSDFRSQEGAESLTSLVNSGGWSIAVRAVVDANLPSGPEDARQWLRRRLLASDPRVFADLVRSERELDILDLLPEVSVPTLVLHRRGSSVVPLSAARAASAQITGAKLLLLEGDASFPYVNPKQIYEPVLDFIEARRATPDSGPLAAPIGAFRTVLFTEVVGHQSPHRVLAG